MIRQSKLASMGEMISLIAHQWRQRLSAINGTVYICEEKIETIGEGKVYIDIKRSGNKAIVLVEDNGGGVAKKDMKKIFDPYFTTKEKHNGTGLGLYILRLIVEDSMNGKVSLHNGKEGAVFSIEIPLNMG